MFVQVTLLTECFLTEVTLERSVTGVCPHVRLKIRFLRELLPTNLAVLLLLQAIIFFAFMSSDEYFGDLSFPL